MAINYPSNGGSVTYNVTGTSGGGITTHSALTGLSVDDHPQYLNNVRGDARYQPLDVVLSNTTAAFTTADETKLDSITTMTGATSVAVGGSGLVPAPIAGEEGHFLRGDGTWQIVSGGGGGVSDHGALTGLGDDDHTQYHTDARGDLRYSALAHTHTGTYQPLDPVLTATTASFTLADEAKLAALVNTPPMMGATSTLPGIAGYVPTPVAGDETKFLTGAGTWAGQVGGITDHGALTGLADDDHSQYHNDARGDLRYAPLVHTHSEMTGATALMAGSAGYVPIPNAGDQDKFLKADGNWTAIATSNPLSVYSITRKLNATGQQGFTSTTPAAINLSASTTNINVGGFSASLATGSLTVNTTGNYQINFTAYIDDNAGTASGLNIFLAVNGVDVVQSAGTADATFSISSSIDTVRPLVAGDVLTLKAASTDGETLNVQGFDFSVVQLASAISPIVSTVAEYGSKTLAANEDVNVSATLWVDRTLSINLPSAGTYRLFWSASGELADAGTVEVALSGRLFNTTTSTAYTQSTAIIVGYDSPTASVSTRIGNGAGSAIVTVTGSNTVVLQTRMSVLSSAVTVIMGDSYARGTTYIAYEKVAGQLPADVFVGATAGVAGGSGFVPAPAAGDQAKFLTGAGTWATPALTSNDQSASGYFDLGNMRIQWGTFTQGSGVANITLPAAFANTSYTLTGNVQSVTPTTSTYGTAFSGKTTTSFITITTSHNGVSVNVSASQTVAWQAIGLKP